MASVSIIMPAYNSQDTIQESIDSVKYQTYQDWELLVVDDGSNDQTKEIVKKNIKQNSRIRLIESNHGGPGGAKNRGIESASGRYLAFIDSDDYFDNDFIAKGVAKLDEGFDCVVFDHIRFNSINDQINHADINPLGSNTAATNNAVWNKMYNAELWQIIRFPEQVLIEDFEVVPVVMSMAKSIGIVSGTYYHYRIKENSIIHNYDASRVGEIKDAINLFLANVDQYSDRKQFNGQLPRYINQIMYTHLRLGVRSAKNRREQALICNDLIQYCKQFNTSEFGIHKVLYSPNSLRQLRNNLMIFLFRIKFYNSSILMTDTIEFVFGKRRNPRGN